MAGPIPAESDLGDHRCTQCGYELGVEAAKSLPPWPRVHHRELAYRNWRRQR